MHSHNELFLCSLECYLGIYFPRCFATREINTKITPSCVLKQFVIWVHTLFSMCVQCFRHLLASNSWHHTLFFRDEFLCLTKILFTIQPKALTLVDFYDSPLESVLEYKLAVLILELICTARKHFYNCHISHPDVNICCHAVAGCQVIWENTIQWTGTCNIFGWYIALKLFVSVLCFNILVPIFWQSQRKIINIVCVKSVLMFNKHICESVLLSFSIWRLVNALQNETWFFCETSIIWSDYYVLWWLLFSMSVLWQRFNDIICNTGWICKLLLHIAI